MTIPSNNIKASQIQAEFGGANPIKISEYYRKGVVQADGSLVKVLNNTLGIPAFGQISFGDFAGRAAADSIVVHLSSASISNSTTVPYTTGPTSASVLAAASTTAGSGTTTYSWVEKTPLNSTITISSTIAANPTFTYAANITHGDTSVQTATWTVTASDSTGSSSLDLSVSLTISKTKQPVSISWPSPPTVLSHVSYGSINSASVNIPVSVTGGRGPFTYLWAYVSGTSFALTNQATATLNLAHSEILTGPANSGVVTGTYKVTVIDTFDGETHAYPAINGQSVSFQLIEDASTAGPVVVVNNVINTKTDPYLTVGNNVSVPASTTISHIAHYSISSYLWTGPVGSSFSISSAVVQNPTWTYTNDITGPASTPLVSEIWTLKATDQYGYFNSNSGTVQLQITESAGTPPSITVGSDPLSGSATTNYGSINTTSVTSNAVVVVGQHAISSIAWSYVSNDLFTITNGTAGAGTFSFTQNLVGPASWSKSGRYKLTVTDVVGQAVSHTYTVNLSHTETKTGSVVPVVNAGSNATSLSTGVAGSGIQSVSYEITNSSVTAGTYSLATNSIQWQLVSSNLGGFTTDILLNTWLPNNAINRTPLFSRSENVATGTTSDHYATYRLIAQDIYAQSSAINASSDVTVHLKITELNDTTIIFLGAAGTLSGQAHGAANLVSGLITVSDITTGVTVSVTGGSMSVNGGAYITGSAVVVNGNTIRLRGNASNTFGGSSNVTLNGGGATEIFTIVTALQDTLPSFSPVDFTDSTGVALNSVSTSTATTVSGFTATTTSPLIVTVVGGSFDINGSNIFIASYNHISNSPFTIRARVTAAGSFNTSSVVTLSIGSGSINYSATTQFDTVPNVFTFVDQINIATSSLISSAAVTITGIGTSVAVILSGSALNKKMRISGGLWTTSGTISNGQTLEVQGTSSGTLGAAATVVASIGGVSDTFSITTVQPLSASVSPASIDQSFISSNNFKPAISVSTASLSAVHSGGVGPYTYAWIGNGGGFSINNSTGQSTTTSLIIARPAPGTTTVVTFTISSMTITDSTGATATVTNIPVTFRITGI